MKSDQTATGREAADEFNRQHLELCRVAVEAPALPVAREIAEYRR